MGIIKPEHHLNYADIVKTLHSLMGIIKQLIEIVETGTFITLHSLMGIIKLSQGKAGAFIQAIFTFPYGHY